MRDRDRRKEDPHRQAALAPDRVVVLRSTVHLGAKTRSLVLGVSRVVSPYVRDLIEDRLIDRPEPGQRVFVHGVRVPQQLGQPELGRCARRLLELEPCADAWHRQRGTGPGLAPDPPWDVADPRVDRPVLASSHVPREKADWVDTIKRPRDELVP